MGPDTDHIYTPEEVDAMSEEEKQAIVIGQMSELEGMARFLETLRAMPAGAIRLSDGSEKIAKPVVHDKKERRARSKQSRIARRKNRG